MYSPRFFFFVGDGTVPMKISFGAQEPTSPRHGAGVGKGAEPPFFLADCTVAFLQTALQNTGQYLLAQQATCARSDWRALPRAALEFVLISRIGSSSCVGLRPKWDLVFSRSKVVMKWFFVSTLIGVLIVLQKLGC